MSEINWVIHPVQHRPDVNEFNFMFFCPGCECGHGIVTHMGNRWTFNGDMVKPTISPSILVTGVQPLSDEEWEVYMAGGTKPEKRPLVCHSFVNNGMIQFLSDCTHKLAGQTVPLEPF